MARGIEFTKVRTFEAESRRMPNFTLHELAHAYHHRTLPDGFDNAEIRAAYDRAKASGSYDEVERSFGEGRPNTRERAYAMTNPMEYFAESTEASVTCCRLSCHCGCADQYRRDCRRTLCRRLAQRGGDLTRHGGRRFVPSRLHGRGGKGICVVVCARLGDCTRQRLRHRPALRRKARWHLLNMRTIPLPARSWPIHTRSRHR
jgi:hypothetical protein